MEILSTVEAWCELAERADADDRVAAWLTSYEAMFPSVFEVYYRAWGTPAKRREAALRAPALRAQILDAEDRARHLLGRAEKELRDRGLLEDELSAVLLVGTRTSNGWVAEHNGRRSLFLALEYLGDPPYDDLLVVHELAHVVQAQRAPATRARTYASSLAVMVEGVATATSRVLRPGHSDSAYLWMDENHQNWIHNCVSNTRTIATHVLQQHQTPDDDEAVAPLFRNQPRLGIPPRSGYWVGDQIAQGLLQKGCGLADLLSIGPREARDHILHWANTNSG